MENTEKEVYYKFTDAVPCPFCGCDDITIKSDYYGHYFTIYCHNCFAMGPGKMTEAEAKQAWNHRA